MTRLPYTIALGLASLLAAVAAGAGLADSALGLGDANTVSLQVRPPARDRVGEHHLIRQMPQGDESARVFKRQAQRLARERRPVHFHRISVFRPVLHRTRAGRTRITFRPDADGGGYPTVPGLLGYSLNDESNIDACSPGGQFVPVAGNGGSFSDYGLSYACSQDVGMQGQFVVTPGITYGVPWSGYFGWAASAPSGVTIDSVTGSFEVTNAGASQIADYGGDGWFGETYSNGYPQTELTNFANADDAGIIETDINDTVNGANWAWLFTCGAQPYCGGDISGEMVAATMYATETAHPAISESSALTSRTGWLWNPAGDPWPLSVGASDPSGVCALTATLAGKTLVATAGTSDPTSQWMICGDALGTAAIDLNALNTGTQTLTTRAENGAFLTSSQSHTIRIDDTPVSVALSTPNDSNPTVWVDHAVTVDAVTTAGPSGVAGTSCSVDGAPTFDYTGAFQVDGTGRHSVSCTGSDSAVDPQGQPRTGTSSMPVAIDETPPSLAFTSSPPADPSEIVADTADGQSGVQDGVISYTQTGTSTWHNVPTNFTGSQLVGTINDATLRGPYTIRAISCDVAGNCTTTTEPVTMPLRTQVSSLVGFQKLIAPRRVVSRRVLVGWHWARVRRHGHRVRVKVGGHRATIKVVIGARRRCATKRVKTGPHRWRQINACRQVKITTLPHHRVAHGHAITISGLLSSDGVALPGRQVVLTTAPDRPWRPFHKLAVVTTDNNGAWSYRLPAGSSRIVRATFQGSDRLLPSTGSATVYVPAKIKLTVSPKILPWSGTVHIAGHLVGGLVPHDGVALHILAYYPGRKAPAELFAMRTNRKGAFSTTWTYHSGHGVAGIKFAVTTTGKETDYPWLPGQSRPVTITFGR